MVPGGVEPDVLSIILFCSIACTVSQRDTPSLVLCFWRMRKAKRNKPWDRKHMHFRTQHVSFFVTFNKANWLDRYHVVFGELVEGHDVLAKIEESGSRDGHTKEHITIENFGSA